MIKQNVRIAQARVYFIKKRARKEAFTIVDGVGLNDSEAIEHFKKNFQQEKSNWKSYRCIESIVYDAVRNIYEKEGYSTLTRALMPSQIDNAKKFEFAE